MGHQQVYARRPVEVLLIHYICTHIEWVLERKLLQKLDAFITVLFLKCLFYKKKLNFSWRISLVRVNKLIFRRQLHFRTVQLLSLFPLQKNTLISPKFLVWKFCRKAEFPHSFGWIAGNYAETVPFYKIWTQENQVKLRGFLQCSTLFLDEWSV